jgi:hypothetical protein
VLPAHDPDHDGFVGGKRWGKNRFEGFERVDALASMPNALFVHKVGVGQDCADHAVADRLAQYGTVVSAFQRDCPRRDPFLHVTYWICRLGADRSREA